MNKILEYIEKGQGSVVDRAIAALLDENALPLKLMDIRTNSNKTACNTLRRIMGMAEDSVRQMQNAAALERIRAPEMAAVEELIVEAREAPQAAVELVTSEAMAEMMEAEGLADAVLEDGAALGIATGVHIGCDHGGLASTTGQAQAMPIEASESVRAAIAECMAQDACAIPATLLTSATTPSQGSVPTTIDTEVDLDYVQKNSARVNTTPPGQCRTDGSTMYRETQ